MRSSVSVGKIPLVELINGSPFLFGRTLGRELYWALERVVDERPDVDVFGLSLKGIEATDAVFARESVVSLVKGLRMERGFYLSDVGSQDLLDNWHYAALAKDQTILVDRGPAGHTLIGPALTPDARRLLDYAITHRTVTTAMVARKWSVSAPNASAKLKSLYRRGLLLGRKEASATGGMEFVYEAIRPLPPSPSRDYCPDIAL